tara:strand:+ start:1925 stop:2323 length:399 start_codon:yes stop_codon:yes gene_type:complete
MRVTNIDTLSALLDRLITENIKLYFFEKNNEDDRIKHQKLIITEIKNKLSELFLTSFEDKSYIYMSEKRTFDESVIIEELEDLVTNDIHIGESDRERLKIVMMNEKRLRKSNEGRSRNKNEIDKQFKKIIED